MVGRYVLVAVALVGCSPNGPTADGGADDATRDDATSLDATEDPSAPLDAGPGCNPDAPFDPPAMITELDTPFNEWNGRLTHDELTVFFDRGRSNDAGLDAGTARDIFTASRASRGAPFSSAAAISLDTSSDEEGATVTGDALTLFFASDRSGTAGGRDLWVATRATASDAFANATRVTELDTASQENAPYVMPDGLTIYFDSDRNGSGDLFRATRPSTSSPFVLDPVAFGTLNNASVVESSPVVTLDELTVYYAINGALYRATRASTTSPFGIGQPVEDVNFPTPDAGYLDLYPTWISDDGCRLFLAIYRPSDSLDLYVATKPAN